MKKTTLAIAIAVSSLTASMANASYEDNTFYTGAKIGWSNFFHNHNEKVPDTSKVKHNTVGAGAFVGFQANPYLAAELGYDWLGPVKYKSDLHKDSKTKVSGVSLTAKLSYPISFISDDLDVYARAGAFVRIAKWEDGITGHSSTDTGVSPTYALGLDYRFDEDFSTRLEYQYVQRIGNDGPAKTDNGLLSLGITYRLGTVYGEPARPVEIATQENRYVLDENVLFNYAKADLKEEGRSALDALVSTLIQIKPNESAIIVVGHTDRIGSDNYNQKLSEQRANSVMKYLLSKGIPADLISARGAGKSEPLTGDRCNALKGSELKACLAPDRRVEIQVKAHTFREVKVEE